jgi:hypothetical protein
MGLCLDCEENAVLTDNDVVNVAPAVPEVVHDPEAIARQAVEQSCHRSFGNLSSVLSAITGLFTPSLKPSEFTVPVLPIFHQPCRHAELIRFSLNCGCTACLHGQNLWHKSPSR